MERERWSILKRSGISSLDAQREMTDAQVHEILDFEKVLWEPAESAGKAFQALANWISCGVFCGS